MIPDLKYRVLGHQTEIQNQANMSAEQTDTSPVTMVKREIIDISDSEAVDGMSEHGDHPHHHGMPSSEGGMLMSRAVSRRPKRLTPDNRKDDNYWQKRKKNNEAARRSREIKRQVDNNARKRLAMYEHENKLLKNELLFLKDTFKLSQDLVYIGIGPDGKFISEQLSKVRAIAFEEIDMGLSYEQMDYENSSSNRYDQVTSPHINETSSSSNTPSYLNGPNTNGTSPLYNHHHPLYSMSDRCSPQLPPHRTEQRFSFSEQPHHQGGGPHYDSPGSDPTSHNNATQSAASIRSGSNDQHSPTHFKHYRSASSSESGYEGSATASPLCFHHKSAFSPDPGNLPGIALFGSSNNEQHQQQLSNSSHNIKSRQPQDREFTVGFTPHHKHLRPVNVLYNEQPSNVTPTAQTATSNDDNGCSNNDENDDSKKHNNNDSSSSASSSNNSYAHKPEMHYTSQQHPHYSQGKSLKQLGDAHLLDSMAKEKVIQYLKQHGVHNWLSYPDSENRYDSLKKTITEKELHNRLNRNSPPPLTPIEDSRLNVNLMDKISKLSEEVELMKRHLNNGMNGISSGNSNTS